ncbi:peptidyl-prolyl cis-trans isomerase, partial [Coprinellus micaceus]
TTFKPASCNRGSRKSKAGDPLKVNYSGVYWKDQDTIVNSNFKSGKPYEFNLGLGQVIAGWDRGLTKMCVGEKRVLTIPT